MLVAPPCMVKNNPSLAGVREHGGDAGRAAMAVANKRRKKAHKANQHQPKETSPGRAGGGCEGEGGLWSIFSLFLGALAGSD